MKLSYLSYAGEDGFRGGVVVEGDNIIDAAKEARRLGISPGGEVLWLPVPDHMQPPESFRNRLLSVEDLQAMDPEHKAVRCDSFYNKLEEIG